MSEELCENCHFWDALDKGGGLCRRHAPQPATPVHPLGPSGSHEEGYFLYPTWPVTVRTDWCGEFQTRKGQ